jgi:hypothetical protein
MVPRSRGTNFIPRRWHAPHFIVVPTLLSTSTMEGGTWAGARAQSVLMSVWRTCRQQGRGVLDFLVQCGEAYLRRTGYPSLLQDVA